MTFPRSSGVLLHPTSLPSRYGIGDLGDEACKFVDFLVKSGQSLWQILPLGPTGFGDSPYACFSAFAGNPLLVGPEALVKDGLLEPSDLDALPEYPIKRVDFGLVVPTKNALLKKAHDRFKLRPAPALRKDFTEFCAVAQPWLDDYALFRALKDAHEGKAWNLWPAELARRDKRALAHARKELHDSVEAHKFFQFLFFRQWKHVKAYANEHGIKIIGDVPIFTAYDSTDVWVYPELFKLDAKGTPTVVAGVPPDYFSETGQLWGNPMYDWDNLRGIGFEWWVERVRAVFELVDVVRMDHFRGFAACWEIPNGEKTAINGKWVAVPGNELFTVLKNRLGELPIIAEDLGVITPDVEALRDGFGFPGMRILQFAFGGDTDNGDLPHNYTRNTVVYTGTHDNDTTVGWFKSKPNKGSTRDDAQIKKERAFCLKYLKSDGKAIHWDFIRAVHASVACFAMVPVQDLLGLGTEARMNLPASEKGNWNWRFQAGDLTDDIAARLKDITETYGRAPHSLQPTKKDAPENYLTEQSAPKGNP